MKRETLFPTISLYVLIIAAVALLVGSMAVYGCKARKSGPGHGGVIPNPMHGILNDGEIDGGEPFPASGPFRILR